MKARPKAKSKDVAVLGFQDGAAGQVETWFEEVTGFRIACFVHEAVKPLRIDPLAENKKRVSHRVEFPTPESFKGRRLITSLSWIEELKKMGIRKVLPLTPDNRARLRQIAQCRTHGLELVSAIHPTVTILAEARIEPGVWINANSLIGYKAEIASGVLINTGAQIDHHNVLESCCQVDPGVITAGFATLRACCHVHTGAVIINRVEIGADAIIGAGAVVLENIPPRCTAVGVPARVIKRRASSAGK
jgi:serine O-acetyltransferase